MLSDAQLGEIALIVHWQYSCSLLEELHIRIPSGDAKMWLAAPPEALRLRLQEVCDLPDPTPEQYAHDYAHWLLGSGGASGYNDRPTDMPDWSADGGYTLGDDGAVYLDEDELGSVHEVTGISWLSPEDFTHLRNELQDMNSDGPPDEGAPMDARDVMTSIGYVMLHADGEVVAHGRVLLKFEDEE
ncbi:MAG: hypothetical protein EBT64_06750 [Gammaproteobacteria bacterium]|nr:hypothetical protein [Gammaproteobacteria bacterium]